MAMLLGMQSVSSATWFNVPAYLPNLAQCLADQLQWGGVCVCVCVFLILVIIISQKK